MSLLRAGSAGGRDAASERVWMYRFPKCSCYSEHPNPAASEERGLNWEAMPWEPRGEVAVQGPRMRVRPMDPSAHPPHGWVGFWGAGLGDALGGGWFAQRGGLVPSPGAGL